MSFDALLTNWIRERRDVAFPIHKDDHPTAFSAYGFSADGRRFSTGWDMTLAGSARVIAAFTGVLFARLVPGTVGDEYELLLFIYTAPPIQPLEWLPEWYPYPAYARYGRLTREQATALATDLFTDDSTRISALLAPVSDMEVAQRVTRNEQRFATVKSNYFEEHLVEANRAGLVAEFVNNRISTGVPVAAGEELVRRGGDLSFHLHPMHQDGEHAGEIDETLFFNVNYYFGLWGSLIENRSAYYAAFRQRVLGPPLTNGTIHRVRSTHDPADPPERLHQTIAEAIAAANEHDTILILDQANYGTSLFIDKYLSIIGLVPADDDIKVLASLDDDALTARFTERYPRIQELSENRGIRIRYGGPTIAPPGMIYIANLVVMDCGLSLTQESDRELSSMGTYRALGGGGILIDGSRSAAPDSVTFQFSRVHLNNCGVFRNRLADWPRPTISSFPVAGRFLGGGVMCHASSPLIGNCLIRGNSAPVRGGGIGVFNYSFPYIVSNIIEWNHARGAPDGESSIRGDGGDGGGIAVFVGFPTNIDTVSPLLEPLWVHLSETFAGRIHTLLPTAWIPELLELAKTRWVRISNNTIRRNAARLAGGGVYITVCSTVSLYENEIYDNVATDEHGGGIGATYGCRVQINHGSVRANRAGQTGGGINLRSSRMNVTDVAISDNSVTGPLGDVPQGSGGGISIQAHAENDKRFDVILHLIFTHIPRVECMLERVTVANNNAPQGGGIYVLRDMSSYDNIELMAGVLSRLVGGQLVHVEATGTVSGNTPNDFHFIYRQSGSFGAETVVTPTGLPVNVTF